MALPLLPLGDTPRRSPLAEALDMMGRRQEAATGFFAIPSAVAGTTLTPDERVTMLRNWCMCDNDGLCRTEDVGMKKDQAEHFYSLRSKEPGVSEQPFFTAYHGNSKWNYMVDVLTSSTVEITLSRYFQYKQRIVEALEERKQMMKINSWTEETKPKGAGVGDPRTVKFLEIENRFQVLRMVIKECMRRVIGLHLLFFNAPQQGPNNFNQEAHFANWMRARVVEDQIVDIEHDAVLYREVIADTMPKPDPNADKHLELGMPFGEYAPPVMLPPDEPPITKYNPVAQLLELEKTLTVILTKYEGNDMLKKNMYADLCKYLCDGRRAMDVFRNWVFMGPSGVGKTTWARLLGKIYKAAGVYIFGKVTETDGGDYIGAYMGFGGPQTKNVLNSNLENIVIIDEAYSMTEQKSSSGVSIGAESVTAIVNYMDKFKGCIMLVLAGYEDKMATNPNAFLKVNEGLDRRFLYKVVFKLYTPKQLVKILRIMLTDRGLVGRWQDTLDPLQLFITNLEEGSAMLKRPKTALPALETPYVELFNTMKMMHEALFSRQGGSIENLAGNVETYTSLPFQTKPRNGGSFLYDPDMINTLGSLMPMHKQDELQTPGSFLRLVFQEFHKDTLKNLLDGPVTREVLRTALSVRPAP